MSDSTRDRESSILPARAPACVTTGHDVLFYRGSFPAAELAIFCTHALGAADEALIAVATTEHLTVLRSAIDAAGGAVDAAFADGRIQFVAVEEALAAACVDSVWNEPGFDATVADRVRSSLKRFSKVRVYGELVDALCREDRSDVAIELEATWNRLRERHAFELLCSYSLEHLERPSARGRGVLVCASHAEVRFAAGCA